MGVLTFVCNIGSSLFLLYEIMLLATLMSKNVPLEGKGMLIGLYSWAGSVGVLVVSKCGDFGDIHRSGNRDVDLCRLLFF